MLARLQAIDSPLINDVRGTGLLVGREIDTRASTRAAGCERLLQRGVLSKETHDTVVRLAPPLVIARADIDWALGQVRAVFAELGESGRGAPACAR